MAEGVTPATLAGALGTPHRDRFRMAFAALVGIAIGAVAVTIAIAIRGGGGGGKAVTVAHWSAWTPTTTGKLGATEIAEHVAPLYRLTAAAQMDVATVINIANPNDADATTGSGLTVAVGSESSSSDENLSLLGGTTVAYDLCGVGASGCTVPGTPSGARLLLLRREAFELALYTLKYLPSTQNVIAVLPPGRATTTSTANAPLTAKPPTSSASTGTTTTPVTIAVLFVRNELQPWLQTPLTQTLSEYPPAISQLPTWQKTNEAGLVDQITGRGLFYEKIESQQDGGNLLVLSPVPPQ